MLYGSLSTKYPRQIRTLLQMISSHSRISHLEVFDGELVCHSLCNSRTDLLEDSIAGSCTLSDGREGLLQVDTCWGIMELAVLCGDGFERAVIRT